MAGFIFKTDRSGIGELLKSAPVAEDLHSRAKAIAAAAGSGMEADVQVGRTRARAGVITATTQARLAEANGKALTRAFGTAGRS